MNIKSKNELINANYNEMKQNLNLQLQNENKKIIFK